MPNLRPYLSSLRFWLALGAAATFTIGAIRASAAEHFVSNQVHDPSMSVLWLSITAFMLVVATLFLVAPKTKSSFGKPPKKSVRKSTKRR